MKSDVSHTPRQTRVKICGMTRACDAELAVSLGADYLGFVFHAKSPRAVTLREALRICEKIPPTIGVVGVFVNSSARDIVTVARALRVAFVQLHGDESSALISRVRGAGIRVARAIDPGRYRSRDAGCADFTLFDNQTRAMSGGTGQPFDWSRAPKLPPKNLILAGGLSIDNYREGWRRFHPLILDFNSGVESRAGAKSERKLRELFRDLESWRTGGAR